MTEQSAEKADIPTAPDPTSRRAETVRQRASGRRGPGDTRVDVGSGHQLTAAVKEVVDRINQHARKPWSDPGLTLRAIRDDLNEILNGPSIPPGQAQA